MRTPQLQPAPPGSAAGATWLSSALPPDLFTPRGCALDGFAATARLLHPAGDVDGHPELGELGEPGWDALLSHLTRWSGSDAACLLAVDEDLPWVRGGAHVGFYGDPHHSEPPQEPAFGAELLTAAPRVQLLRTCLLLSGPLAAVRTLGRTWRHRDRRWFERHGPTALWPAGRSWLVLTDLDADRTVLAGPRTLVDAVSADDRLEAQPQAAS
ncbi:hypothetical protein [Kineococcus arenarius]|uniref:hypothetical protein n=1 Tax=unclassified Kineococcus TaxID=2621656 RepID=UPI003D7E68BE